MGGVAAASIVANALQTSPVASSVTEGSKAGSSPGRRAKCLSVRRSIAQQESQIPAPAQITNGDEERYPDFIGNFSKGLPHNPIGEVDAKAYRHLVSALVQGTTDDLEEVSLGGGVKLVNPLAGIAFDVEGADSHQFAIGPPPGLASRARADDMVELYWMALCRDVNFIDYSTDPIAQAAAAELSSLHGFEGPRSNGRVTAQTLFRGFTAEDLIGPYLSQSLLKPFNYGQFPISGRIITYVPRLDYLTDPSHWLAARNGQGPFVDNENDHQLRHIRNGRDAAAYVHSDQVFQAFYNAGIWLLTNGAAPNPGNPYVKLRKQSSFATFGQPCFLTLLAEVSNRALKAVWYAKWFVHRTLRPEDFGGLVHLTKTGQAGYPLHGDVLDSQAVARTFENYGTYLHPQAYPEGCPQHPSYAQGHGAIAGACATILKGAFDGATPFNTLRNGTPVTASKDGLSLITYVGPDADHLTVLGEINKLASNFAIARNFAGVHWRTDYSDGLQLGEAVALSILREQNSLCAEVSSGLTIRKFDGSTITV
jgi:hypothetical protein